MPVNLPTGNFPAYYAGIDVRTIMYDYAAMHRAWIKFMDDFGDMDTFNAPSLIPSGKVTEALELQNHPVAGPRSAQRRCHEPEC